MPKLLPGDTFPLDDENVRLLLSKIEKVGLTSFSHQLGISRQGLHKNLRRVQSKAYLSKALFVSWSDAMMSLELGSSNKVLRDDVCLAFDLRPLFLEACKSGTVEISSLELQNTIRLYMCLVQRFGKEKAELVAQLVLP